MKVWVLVLLLGVALAPLVLAKTETKVQKGVFQDLEKEFGNMFPDLKNKPVRKVVRSGSGKARIARGARKNLPRHPQFMRRVRRLKAKGNKARRLKGSRKVASWHAVLTSIRRKRNRTCQLSRRLHYASARTQKILKKVQKTLTRERNRQQIVPADHEKRYNRCEKKAERVWDRKPSDFKNKNPDFLAKRRAACLKFSNLVRGRRIAKRQKVVDNQQATFSRVNSKYQARHKKCADRTDAFRRKVADLRSQMRAFLKKHRSIASKSSRLAGLSFKNARIFSRKAKIERFKARKLSARAKKSSKKVASASRLLRKLVQKWRF